MNRADIQRQIRHLQRQWVQIAFSDDRRKSRLQLALARSINECRQRLQALPKASA